MNNKFFIPQGTFSLEELAEKTKSTLKVGDSNKIIESTAPLHLAKKTQISFLDNSKYSADLLSTKAGAVFVKEKNIEDVPQGTAVLVSQNPHLSFALAGNLFFPPALSTGEISDKAYIDPSATIGKNVQIMPGAYIGAEVLIGNNCIIMANAHIGAKVTIGNGTIIGANASLEFCELGVACNIHPGVRIGTRGFGFAIDPAGYVDVPQTGFVQIGNMVEIGANSTIDRGMGNNTEIGDGSKIDNLCHIAHNAKLGKGCVIAAMSGISGSTHIGDYVVIGAQVGFAGHLKIGSGTQIAARSGVTKDLPNGSKVGGFPAEPINIWRKRHAIISRLMKKKG